MGKSDENQTEKSVHKATCTDGESKHKAPDGESKHNNKPSFDAMTFEERKDEEHRHSEWCDQFRQLCEYKVQFGDCIVPHQYSANLKLGTWVSHQRNQYRMHQEGKPSYMTAERLRALNGIRFDWGTNNLTWDEHFEQLCEFKEQIGHCLVPRKCAANPGLGTWVSSQRTQYRMHQEGKPSQMTAQRLRALNGIAFDWGRGTVNLTWNEHFEQLCDFKVQFGHCNVPYKYSADPKLRKWVRNQRSMYRLAHQKGKLSPMTKERIRELESIGFDWRQARPIGHSFAAYGF